MGYYIQTPGSDWRKAEIICRCYGGKIIPQPKSFDEISPDLGLVCVVRNPWFEAAAFAFCKEEFEAFLPTETDSRIREWLVIDRKKAEELSQLPERFRVTV